MRMPFKEFILRQYAWKKKEEREWIRTREVAYNVLVAGGLDPERVSKQKFMPIGNEVVEQKSVLEMLKEEKRRLNG